MGTAGEWIEGETEVFAAACVYNVNIHLFTSDPAHDKVISPSPDLQGVDTRNVGMAFYNQLHYQAIERIPDR